MYNVYELQQNEALIALKKLIDEIKSTLTHQDELISRQEHKIEVLQKQTVEPFLKKAAAPILLFLVGSQPRMSTPSRHFTGKIRAAMST